MKARLTAALALLLAASSAAAQTEAPPPPIPEPEALPPKVQDPDEQIQPEVVIRREEGRRVEEYSANGVVYMLRIVPDIGPAYYLIDTSGDGNFETRFQHDQIDPVRPAHWKIKEW